MGSSQNDLSEKWWRGEYTNYRVSRRNLAKMRELKERFNIKSYDAIISFLVHSLGEKKYPSPSVEAVMADSVPVIITGIPGAGKTTFLRDKLIPEVIGPIFVLDPHDEYTALRVVSLGDFFSIDFGGEKRKLRLVPNPNIDVCRSEADIVFRHLTMFQRLLGNWVIIVEEGHRFQESLLFKSLLAEARKHTRKMIVVSHQVEAFEGLGHIHEVQRPLDVKQ